jgi:predicted DNA-binding transcriptional regulator AlpA
MKLTTLLDGEEALDTSKVLELLGCHRVTLHDMVRSGLFPKPASINNRNFWKKSDIEAYLESKKVNASKPKAEKD